MPPFLGQFLSRYLVRLCGLSVFWGLLQFSFNHLCCLPCCLSCISELFNLLNRRVQMVKISLLQRHAHYPSLVTTLLLPCKLEHYFRHVHSPSLFITLILSCIATGRSLTIPLFTALRKNISFYHSEIGSV